MSDDIVQGLRFGQLTEKRANEAADRIDKLETALRKIAAFADVQPGPYADVVRLAYITGLHELAHKASEALE